MDDSARNNYIVIVLALAAGAIFTSNILIFTDWITDIADHIEHVVDLTAANMTTLTTVLIKEQIEETDVTQKAVNNQTREIVAAMRNFTNEIVDYSGENDRNLNNVTRILSEIRDNKTL